MTDNRCVLRLLFPDLTTNPIKDGK
ncbi:hypothetical protein AvCA_16920 [Azotobacter vinelandii CA]|uniref:Uncharacterized protein n=2 Tax=Azotobacter vinelandii TaxID=354 RepID=C1DSF1_AZOVD|nr:hypothetical protein Avin_16920 [Azotobacter vinelandii DJ]AGK16943.1 hypothetical protein AvCA_16920 [Azotobacter vinelandii CA]AGK20070.1 hypothetical protein AvCA6_16920 [Azotobacter vinelandii CA6]